MWYIIIALLLGLGNPVGTTAGDDEPTEQTTDGDGGDEGEAGTVRPPKGN